MRTKSFRKKAVCIHVQNTEHLDIRLVRSMMAIIGDVSVFIHASVDSQGLLVDQGDFNGVSTGECKTADPRSTGFGSIIKNGRFWSGISVPQHLRCTHAMMMSAWLKRCNEMDTGVHYGTTALIDGSTLTPERVDVVAGLFSKPLPNFTVVSRIGRSRTDANILALDPTLIAGRSIDIDSIVRAHHAYSNGSLHRMLSSSPSDPAYHMCSLGCLLMRWVQIKNLHVMDLA